MHIGKIQSLQRREFLRRASLLGLAGSAAPWALTLSAIGEAAAADASGYKALVCVFLNGGNDHGNTLVPYDLDSHTAYAAIRQTLATPRDQLANTVLTPGVALGGGRQMALAPTMSALTPAFNAGRLGVLLNIGPLVQPTSLAEYQAKSVPLPPRLFSHNDQQSVWQAAMPEGATTGWGGRIGDLFLNSNGNATFTCINASGNAVFLSGQQAVPYQISTGGAIAINGVTRNLYGSASCSAALRSLITDPREHWMEQALSRVTNRSISAQTTATGALATAPTNFTVPFDTDNSLASQLLIVARLIAGRASLGVNRQVFFVSTGGFDLHDNLNANHPGLLGGVANAMAAFDAAMLELGVANQVTAFTASDFGRTLSSNGDGSDHGWGGYHFVQGGAVQGGRFWGQLPEVSVNGADDVGQGRLLPTTSVDQLAATLARWMGLSDSEIDLVVPGISHFTQRDLGFMLG